MEPAQGEERDGALLQLAKLCLLRAKGSTAEEQIARELGFVDDDGHPLTEAMYERLARWNVPDWCARPPRPYTRTAGREGQRGSKKRRKARGTGDNTTDLPPAGSAVALFRWDFETLKYYLGRLPDLSEQHQSGEDLNAGRFVWSFWVGEDWDYHHKDEYDEERWRALHERFGDESSEEIIAIPIDPVLQEGAGHAPWKGLVVLIAVHALLHQPGEGEDETSIEGAVDDLIHRLHPDPDSIDKPELYKPRGYVDELRTSAESLAKVLRGVEVRSGRRGGAVPDLDHMVAVTLIAPLVEEGLTDEQILARIQKQYRPLAQEYDVAGITRLRKLNLPEPVRKPPHNRP
jgi:hypothetical protein